jgi:flagellar biosynthesis component FlhA
MHELFSRQDAKKVLTASRKKTRGCEDLVPNPPLSLVVKVFRTFRERVSIRMATILSSGRRRPSHQERRIAHQAMSVDPRMVVRPYLVLPASFRPTPRSSLEQALESSLEQGEHASHLNLPPQRLRHIIDQVNRKVGMP